MGKKAKALKASKLRTAKALKVLAKKAMLKAASAMKNAKKVKVRGLVKPKKPSIIAKGQLAKSQVFKGKKVKTLSGLKASDLTKNKQGEVVSKKQSAAAKKVYAKGLSKWVAAL